MKSITDLLNQQEIETKVAAQQEADVYLEKPEEEITTQCPPATQDIILNLTNRQICVDKANYGPANPQLENIEFWQGKADLFKTSIDQAQTMRCSNCAAFIKKDKMLKCIQKGICQEDMNEASKIVQLANLGYCELFDFKCAGDRTCDAWLVGGPLTDEV
jgi:hypothetical protein